MAKPLIRFKKMHKGDRSISEWHQAAYGGLIFDVMKEKRKIRASVMLGDTSAPYYSVVETIEDGKFWCRCVLSYILRGAVPFGDHDKDSE